MASRTILGPGWRSRPWRRLRARAPSPFRYWPCDPRSRRTAWPQRRFSSCGLLLGDAMDAAAAFDDVERIDLEDVATWKAVGNDFAGAFVVGIVEGRHHHAAVGEIEID